MNTPLSTEILRLIEPVIRDKPFSDVLAAIDLVSAQVYACAPNGTALKALETSHTAQEMILAHILNEEATQKAIVDQSIGKFLKFSRDVGDLPPVNGSN